jgi:Leucine-rich repeat (LRR) protein
LEKKYPHKKEIKVIEREEEISDELIIADFPQLEGIYVSGKHNKKKLTQLHLNNCSQLTELNCGYNKLTKLTITNCPNLQKIDA